MSTDPLGDAIGRSAPAQPGTPGAPDAADAPLTPGAGTPDPGPAGPGAGYQAPSAYEPQPAQAAWAEPEAERPLVERRPEILVGAALAGGFLAAQVLGRIRGR